MKYARIKRTVLELLNQYSIAGEIISPAYNNQSDDMHRIPTFINHALLDISHGTDLLPPDPPDTYELNAPDELIHTACYFAASMLILWDDPEFSRQLKAEYLRRLERLPRHVEITGTSDVWFAPDS